MRESSIAHFLINNTSFSILAGISSALIHHKFPQHKEKIHTFSWCLLSAKLLHDFGLALYEDFNNPEETSSKIMIPSLLLFLSYYTFNFIYPRLTRVQHGFHYYGDQINVQVKFLIQPLLSQIQFKWNRWFYNIQPDNLTEYRHTPARALPSLVEIDAKAEAESEQKSKSDRDCIRTTSDYFNSAAHNQRPALLHGYRSSVHSSSRQRKILKGHDTPEPVKNLESYAKPSRKCGDYCSVM